MKVEVIRPEDQAKTYAELRIGQVAFWGKHQYLLLKTYSGLVDLRNPRNTWLDGFHGTGERFTPLPAGTKIILEVE